jgi:hypothetical protein
LGWRNRVFPARQIHLHSGITPTHTDESRSKAPRNLGEMTVSLTRPRLGTSWAPRRTWEAVAMRKLKVIPSLCWICRAPVEGLEDEVLASLLLHLKLRSGVRGCSSQCEEVQSDSGVVFARFYRLACHHYCGSHIDHRCCRCRATRSSTKTPGVVLLPT